MNIPYITLRAGEVDTTDEHLALRPAGTGFALAYEGETDDDRDEYRMLCARVSQYLDQDGNPTGQPRWAFNHPGRQRECMAEMLCHFCKGEPSQTRLGFLFLDVTTAAQRRRPTWPEGLVTGQPPLCLPHAREAYRCTHGRKNGGFTALRVMEPRLHSVTGTPYQLSGLSVRPAKSEPSQRVSIPLTHPHRKMLVTYEYAAALHRVTVVNLQEELQEAGV